MAERKLYVGDNAIAYEVELMDKAVIAFIAAEISNHGIYHHRTYEGLIDMARAIAKEMIGAR